ncbi:10-formyltetrahydrofolate:L-methionyl-tRNA(fMet) N-formyltransferase [Candidatus Accumulibacter aalborgensis]|uniref:Methionyl-tRNA formyltransferase n=1 Tax=Candidatus Accumulibacter aalborgensis TaxID=1860102 RepID=A0A1A8XTW2_9PROT|nr:methionyl-tRNA formyltransferase [Candidatus Accumulibacter aalborgensis]SBT08176.1 10-formyltetrahydrofolate:L-methionyl-tRNA(fMet) N-formyltransferase [Candidatus Accumulibacter aalborgensis]
MRLVFAGTPAFAARALQEILSAGHQVVLVLTQPDRPAGRGMVVRSSPVKQLAQAAGIPFFQPSTLRDAFAQERIHSAAADAMIVAAYGLILPQAVLDMPRWGCINIHASLLPRWRGAAPIQRAILAGDPETGVCIMQMEAGLDSGPVLQSASLPIGDDETAASLHDKLAETGARLIVDVLARLPLVACPQAETGVTYAAKIDKAEAIIDWRLPAMELARQVCALNPFPGASCCVDGKVLKIWRAQTETSGGEPGVILAADRAGIVVACGEGALRITELQKAGGKTLSAAQFLAGNRLVVGSRCSLSQP